MAKTFRQLTVVRSTISGRYKYLFTVKAKELNEDTVFDRLPYCKFNFKGNEALIADEEISHFLRVNSGIILKSNAAAKQDGHFKILTFLAGKRTRRGIIC